MGAEVRCCGWEHATRGLISHGEVDHSISDPPYSPKTHSGSVTSIDFDPMTQDERRAFTAALAIVVRRWSIVFTDLESIGEWRDAAEGQLEFVRAGVWVKSNPAPQKTGDRPGSACEGIVVFHRLKANGDPMKKRWNGGGHSALYRTVRARETRHPAQKPLQLMEALVRDFTDAGELIADGYAGSGSTLVAAVQCGRNAIGWEKSTKWAPLARRRVRGAREQFDLYNGPGHSVPKHKQSALPGVL